MKVRLGNYIEEYSVRNKTDEDIPVYSVTNSNGFCTEYFSKDVASKDRTTYKIVPKGYFAYNPSRINVGSVDWQNKEDRVIVSPLYVVFKVKPEIINDYLLYYLKSSMMLQMIKAKASGSVRDNLKFSILSEFPIELPSIEEQQKKVNKLQKIELLESLANQQLEQLDLLSKSRFVEMFKNKGFEQVPLSELATNKVSTAKKDFSPQDLIRYIDISSIDNSTSQMTGFTEYIFKDAPSRAQQHIIKNDIVVSTVRPNLRNVAQTLYDYDNLIASSGFCVLRAKVCARVEYLKAIVCSEDFTNAMSAITTGANYPAIHDSDVMNYIAEKPPLSLQNQFADFVQQVDKSKFTIKQSLKQLELLKKKLMQDYFG